MNNANKAALLDEVRRVLFARSNHGEPFLATVSTLSIRHALAARNSSADVYVLLQTLLSLRDVQNLPHGHWLPVSTRLVPCAPSALVVSGCPTDILQRDFGLSIGGGGLGRMLLGASVPAELPKESLLTWLGVPNSSLQWCEDLIRRADFGEAFGWQELSIYDHWTKISSKRWKPAASVSLPDGAVFARSAPKKSAASHYLLLVREGDVRGLQELPPRFDSRRFALAMLTRAGQSYSYSLADVNDRISMLTCPFLPRAEQRLLSALGRMEARDRGLITEVPQSASRTVRDVLGRLGLTEREPSHA